MEKYIIHKKCNIYVYIVSYILCYNYERITKLTSYGYDSKMFLVSVFVGI